MHRLLFENALYHVMSRGNNRQDIFFDSLDRREFLGILLRAKKEFNLRIYAYALMPNHVHLLFQTPLANISSAMKLINWTYAKRFNSRHMRSGHLFQNRFKSKIIQRDKYFMAVLRYINLNPVKAGLCGKPEEYPWSSHNAYLKGDDGLVDASCGLELFDADPARACIMYEGLLRAPGYESDCQLFDTFKNAILGDSSFKSRIKNEFEANSAQLV